jgi:carbamoyltransferase
MIILGLHFGHDASITLLRDGKVILCMERERFTRAKHCIGLTHVEISEALKNAGINVEEIDFCSVTSTQKIEHIFIDPNLLSFSINKNLTQKNKYWEKFNSLDFKGDSYIAEVLKKNPEHVYKKRLTDNFIEKSEAWLSQDSLEVFSTDPSWSKGGLAEIIECNFDLSEDLRLGMSLPITAKILGKDIPGQLFSHHFAHAAYSFYTSRYSEAAILSHDGSLPGVAGYESGMLYWGSGTKLYPVAPHFLSIGNLYERVAVILNLGFDTGAGKLMGLAPYGKPKFFDKRFVGNFYDGIKAPQSKKNSLCPAWIAEDKDQLLFKWVNHCLNSAEEAGYDLTYLGDVENILNPINVDIAASTQKLIEEVLSQTVSNYLKSAKKHKKLSDGLCLTGGVALNCPANSNLWKEGSHKSIHIPPGVHDGGLSMGSALAFYHNLLEYPRISQNLDAQNLAYLGLKYHEDELLVAAREFEDELLIEIIEDAPKIAAEMLSEDKVIAWFEGRSEIGPRALGHRSILANPTVKNNWLRVNAIKKREFWRPFAPVVLEEYAHEYFEGCPIPSPFMLINAKVKKKNIPAVTHVDNSSRIQTINSSNNNYFKILTEFYCITGVPVLMNTSFNGPGEPVIERGIEAVRFLIETKIDAVLGPNLRLTRKYE